MGGFYLPSIRQEQRMRRHWSISGAGIAAAIDTDPNFANVVALLHLDGADASTTFTDVTGKTWTAPGNGKLTTSTAKFGTAALNATSTSGGLIRTAASADFNFGTGDFTIELWWSPTQSFTAGLFPTLFSYGYTTAGGLLAQTSSATSGAFVFYINGTAVCTESSGVTAASGFHFYRFKRSGTTVTIERDGVQTASGTSSANITNTADFQVGGATGGGGHVARGVIDDFRVTKGVARTGGVPTGPFPDS